MTVLELEHFQSMWAMEDLPFGGDRCWTTAEQVDAIAGAGFDGLAVDLGARKCVPAEVIAPLIRCVSLKSAVFAFVGSDADLDAALEYADKIAAERMVLCARIFDEPPQIAAATINRWHVRAAARGVQLELETHRNTVTNDLWFTSRLLDHLDPAVSLAVDLSHFVCANEFPDVAEPEIERHIDRILTRAGSLQGRVASRCQVQLPLGYPQHRHWEERFQRWWAAGFASMRSRETGSPMFCTELGPRPYAWTDRGGNEVSDRWSEALVLRQWAADAFGASGEMARETSS